MSVAWLAVFTLLGLPATFSAQTRLVEAVDRYFAAPVRSGQFSGAVLVARGDSIIVRRAYGLASVELGVAMTPAHRFLVASLTKTFTGAATVLLARDGALALTDSLVRFLPDFPGASRIRLEHLLLHAAGLANPDYESRFGKQLSLAEVVAAIAARPPLFEPGTKGAYSNAGYNVLAAVLERATGQPYATVLQERLFEPLGMTRTGDAADGSAIPGLATAYVMGPAPLGVRPVLANPSQAPGSGSFYSTVEDLFRWARALQQDRLLDVRALRYPYGWGRRERSGGVWLEQTGMIDGWSSNMYLGLDSAIVVIVLANRQSATFGRWGRDLAGMVMGETVAPLTAEPPVTAPTASFVDFTGHFTGPFKLRITTISSHLFVEVAEWPVTRILLPTGRDQFRIGDFDDPLRFERDSAGKVIAAVWGSGESAVRFSRRN